MWLSDGFLGGAMVRLGTTAHFCKVVVLKLRAVRAADVVVGRVSWGGNGAGGVPRDGLRPWYPERELFIDNLLVLVHLIIEMILVDRPCAMGV